MKRRSFIQFSTAIASLSIVTPQTLFANTPSMAGGLYYTKEAPGRWAKKIGGHLPLIERVDANKMKVTIRVSTAHEMKAYEHYIVKHIILDQNYQFLAEKMFDPTLDKAPISEFELPNDYKGHIYALSVCNKHDTWLNSLEV